MVMMDDDMVGGWMDGQVILGGRYWFAKLLFLGINVDHRKKRLYRGLLFGYSATL